MKLKHIHLILIPVILLSALIAGCDINQVFTITFNMNGYGEPVQQQTVKFGQRVQIPPEPVAEDYSFKGWYKEADCIHPWNFRTPVTSDITLYAKWEFACLAKGTLITLADGTKKTIETICRGDLLKVFDHTTGQLSTAKVIDLWQYDEPISGLIVLNFTNNITIKIVSAHAFYCKEENTYVCLNANNVNSYIGKHFYNAEDGTWEKLVSASVSNEKTETYYLATEKHLNCIADKMLNVEDGVYYVICTTFDYDNNMKTDSAKKNKDILQYGLYGHEDFKYLTEDEFVSHNLAYLKIALGKGIICESDLQLLEKVWTYENEHLNI